MECPACGKKNPGGQMYCGSCGALMSVGETAEDPYYRVSFLGTTTTFSRTAFRAYYGMLAAMWTFFIILAFVGYGLTGDTEGLVIGVAMILLSPILYALVAYRLRVYRRQREKGKGI